MVRAATQFSKQRCFVISTVMGCLYRAVLSLMVTLPAFDPSEACGTVSRMAAREVNSVNNVNNMNREQFPARHQLTNCSSLKDNSVAPIVVDTFFKLLHLRTEAEFKPFDVALGRNLQQGSDNSSNLTAEVHRPLFARVSACYMDTTHKCASVQSSLVLLDFPVNKLAD